MQKQEIEGSRIVLAPDGDVVRSFGRVLVEDYGLPNIAEWFLPLYRRFERREWLKPLKVWTSPLVSSWKNLSAFALKNVEESDVLQEVSQGIRSGELPIPEGITEAPAVPDDITQLTDYLIEYAPHLATTVEETVSPLHDIDRPLERAIATMQRVPFPVQAHTIQALVRGFDNGKKGVFSVGDMGTGKSIQALGVTNVLWERARTSGRKGFVAFILAPGVTIPKWADKEIRATLPDAKIRILENWRDTVAWIREIRAKGYKKDSGLEIVLMGRDIAKLGVRRVPALQWKRFTHDQEGNIISQPVYGWHCPHCGSPLFLPDFEDYDEVRAWSRFAEGFPSTKGHIRWKEAKRQISCKVCHEPLTRFADPMRGEMGRMKNRRIEPAWLIKRYLSGYIDLLIVDELQQYKNQSGQGIAMASLVSAAKRVLALTGTLSDGKASSLFYILSRCDYRRLAEDGFTHNSLEAFIRRYGVIETETRFEAEEQWAGGMTRAKVKNRREKEIPGLSPKLFVNHLADKATFMELGEIGLPLTKLVETPVFIEMDERHFEQYASFQARLQHVCNEAMKEIGMGAFAKFIPSVVNYANQPCFDYEVNIAGCVVKAPAVYAENEYTAKERRLVEDVRREISEGRRCVVYVTYSGTYGQDQRLAKVLNDHGILARVLKSSVDPEERIEWMQQAIEDGVQCVVTNVSLVEVGIDLLDWPTLIFYQLTDKVSTMRQASRRAWRIGQNRECRVIYYIYQRSWEIVQFKSMMAKRSHALLLEGRLDRSEMARYAEKDVHNAVTTAIAEFLEDTDTKDLAQKWQELADRDVPAGVEMLDEETYRVEIQKAMQRLADETRRLCGIKTHESVAQPVQSEPVMATVAFGVEAQAEQLDLFTLLAQQEANREKYGFVRKAKRKKKQDESVQQLSFAF